MVARSQRGSSLVAALVALALCLALIFAFYDRFWWAPDEGAYAHVAERLLDGEVLNREVADMHAGYINVLNAGAMALFGRQLLSLRYPLMAAALVQAALVFLLLVRQSRPGAALAAVASLSLGVLQYLDPTAHWYCQLLAVAVVFTLLSLGPESRARLPLAGALIATATLFRQLSGILIAMGAVTCLLLERQPEGAADPPPRTRRPAQAVLLLMLGGLLLYLARTTEVTGFVLFGVWPAALLLWSLVRVPGAAGRVAKIVWGLAPGALAAALPLVLYHLAHGSVSSWFSDVVVAANALSQMEFTKELTLASTLVDGGIAVLLQARSLAEALNGAYITLLPLLAALLGGLLLFRLERQRGQPPPALAIMASFYGVVSLHYQNITYLYFSVGLTVVGLLSLTLEGGRRLRWAAGLGVAALSAIAVACHAGQSANRGSIGVLTGERVPVTDAPALPRAGLRIDQRDLTLYTRALALIEAEVPRGEAILAMPMNPELYFLSGRRNPFRFFSPTLDLLTDEEVAAALARLTREPPKLIFFAPEDKYNTPHTRELMAALAWRYELLERLGEWEVYRSRP